MPRLPRPLAPLAALGAALAAAPLASAQDYVRDGWYAGARGVYALEDFDTTGSADDGFGFNVFAGYRLFSFLASDFEFEYIDEIRVDGNAAIPSFDLRTFNLSWNFRGYPLAWAFEPSSPLQRVQPYFTAGVANQWIETRRNQGRDENDGNFAARLGGGLDFYLTEKIVLTTDGVYTLGTGDVSDFRYWSIGWGLAYRFGGGEASAGEDEEEADAGDEEEADAEGGE